MALYGELLNTYDPDLEYIYNLFIEYYGNTYFTKIREEEKYYIYMCKIYGLLNNQYRYLIAVVTAIWDDQDGAGEAVRKMNEAIALAA